MCITLQLFIEIITTCVHIHRCPLAQVPLTHDALRMRTRRLCERKGSGRCSVPDSIHEDYFAGGSKRELLEMALLDAVAKFGVERGAYKKVKEAWIYIE